jgi:hypothetical protein
MFEITTRSGVVYSVEYFLITKEGIEFRDCAGIEHFSLYPLQINYT